MGGFPTWTLMGMGVSAGLAVVFTALAFLAQSPSLLVRFRMAGSRFSQGGRRLTGLGLACTLLGMGFFMAGVPIGDQAAVADLDQAVAAIQPTINQPVPTLPVAEQEEIETNIEPIEFDDQPEASAETGAMASQAQAESSEESEASATSSGAFSQAAPESNSDDESPIIPTATEAVATTAADPTDTPTPPPTETPAPTATPTPLPTETPTPTITPTAVNVETISADFVGSVTWVYRVPGNSQLELINNGDQLLLEPGRAMVNGVTWQEVRMLDGRLGWIQLSLLDLGNQ